ncbi:MAG TPA: TerC family protein [Gemmatimonadales bacterium]
MGQHGLAVWLGFTALVVGLLVLDLGVLNRRSHVLSTKEAVSWSGGLIALALLFGLFLYWREGLQHALEYYTGYLIELSLSVDNLFVFILIFSYFSVPAAAQPKVLKWGILGAIVMRFIMIGAGALLLKQFEWIVYVFGGILVLTGIRMLTGRDEQIEPEKNPVVRLARKVLPFTSGYNEADFFIRTSPGKLVATPLLLVLIVVEWSDLVFAIDSIPAIFSVTRDPFLVYSSNVFAILGLRAMFFVLAGIMDRFAYLKPGVALILILVGIKMVAEYWVHVPIFVSLGGILLILTGSIVLSLWRSAREARATA